MLRSLGTSSNGDIGGNDDLGSEPERGPTHHGRVEEKAPEKFEQWKKLKKELTCYQG